MTHRLTNIILDSLNRQILNQLDLANAIKHPGENGRAREQILADFFKQLLPRSYSISTGFVIDAVGGISKQIDLVIYRSDYHPMFEIGSIKHFPVESVAAVIENKASITSGKKLLQALENIKSVKALDRTNQGKNYLIGAGQGSPVNPDNFQHQVFGGIMTEQSLSPDVLRQKLFGFMQANPRRTWHNYYADVRNFSAIYLKSVNPSLMTVIPNEARYLAFTQRAADNYVAPLIELATEVLNFIRVAPIIDYKPTSYLSGGGGQINFWEIPFS
jgi:hypothetical protein